MISENINMQSVSIPEATATHSLPKIKRVCAPTPAAPIVLAIVFTVNIAVSKADYYKNHAFGDASIKFGIHHP